MPVKTTERPLFEPGSLVEASEDLYLSIESADNSLTATHALLVPMDTPGLILAKGGKDLPRRYLVQFVGFEALWIFHHEIRPHF